MPKFLLLCFVFALYTVEMHR